VGSTNKSREKTCSGLGQESKHSSLLQLSSPHVHFIEHSPCTTQELKTREKEWEDAAVTGKNSVLASWLAPRPAPDRRETNPRLQATSKIRPGELSTGPYHECDRASSGAGELQAGRAVGTKKNFSALSTADRKIRARTENPGGKMKWAQL
jgi:hypothetical protein